MTFAKGNYFHNKKKEKNKMGQPGALELSLCLGSEEGPDHQSLLYAVLHCIFARNYF